MSHEETAEGTVVVEAGARPVAGVGPAPPPAPADHENPAIIDARKTFVITVVGAALFIGAVILFIL